MVFSSVKRTFIFVGVITLTTLVSGVSLATAQSPSGTPTSTSTVAVQKPGGSIMEQLQLTSEQKTKIRGIRVSRTRQINQTLLATQQTQLRQELKSGKKLGLALKDLNLSADQKKKILTIVQQSNKDIIATLNPNQQAKLSAYLKQQRQNRTQNPIE